jgi:hypothetical protein
MTTDYRRLATVIALTKRKLSTRSVAPPFDTRRTSATSPGSQRPSCPARSK